MCLLIYFFGNLFFFDYINIKYEVVAPRQFDKAETEPEERSCHERRRTNCIVNSDRFIHIHSREERGSWVFFSGSRGRAKMQKCKNVSTRTLFSSPRIICSCNTWLHPPQSRVFMGTHSWETENCGGRCSSGMFSEGSCCQRQCMLSLLLAFSFAFLPPAVPSYDAVQ